MISAWNVLYNSATFIDLHVIMKCLRMIYRELTSHKFQFIAFFFFFFWEHYYVKKLNSFPLLNTILMFL
jgi:hypothetical protein